MRKRKVAVLFAVTAAVAGAGLAGLARADEVSAGVVTVSGVVGSGVEPGCRLLMYDGVAYLLLARAGSGVDREALSGAVIVRGEVDPGLASTCQQGLPLLVDAVLPAGAGVAPSAIAGPA